MVESAPLAKMLLEFMADWNKKRPPNAGRFANGDPARLGPVEWLSAETALSRGTISNLTTFVVDVATGQARPRYRTTELWIADLIVAALNCPEVFHDGDPPTLVIYRNPAVKREEGRECCNSPDFRRRAAGQACASPTA